MPEIAECRTYVDQLNASYKGKRLMNMEIVGGRFKKEGIPNLPLISFPLENAEFDTKGKFIYATFDDPTVPKSEGGKTYLFITLGMAASFGQQNKHSAVKFTFENSEIFYNDIRHFGTIKVITSKKELDLKLKSLGWDALKEPNPPMDFLNKAFKKNANKQVAEFLLNQKVFAGVGNYIRSEVLYRAEVDPGRSVWTLRNDEIIKICQAIVDVAHEAYNHGGATIRTYNDIYGIAGSFYQKFKVYGQKLDPFGRVVHTFKALDGRTVHWVPEVQK